MVSDNGPSSAAKAFTKTLTALAPRYLRVRSVKSLHNDRMRRQNRSLAEDTAYAHIWMSAAEHAAAIVKWKVHSNH